MPNEKLHRALQDLERKILLLLNENTRLKKELAQSQHENEQLNSKVSNQKNNLDAFQNQMKMSNIVSNMTAGNIDTGKLKTQVEEYIKLIDNYIAHLAE